MSTKSSVSVLTETEYLEQRLDDQIDWFDNKSQSNQQTYKRLRLIEIVAGASIPLLAGFGHGQWYLSLAIGALGLVVAVIAGVMSLYRFQENWTEYRAAAETLKQERFLYLTRAFPYGSDKPFELLVQRVESILRHERSEWLQSMQEASLQAYADRQTSSDSTKPGVSHD